MRLVCFGALVAQGFVTVEIAFPARRDFAPRNDNGEWMGQRAVTVVLAFGVCGGASPTLRGSLRLESFFEEVVYHFVYFGVFETVASVFYGVKFCFYAGLFQGVV